jgi:hypothetical protein
VTIQVGSSGWESKATKAIDKKRRIRLILKGPQALPVGEALRRAPGGGPLSGVVGVDDVALTATICITIIAGLGLAVLAAVCIYGINQGYLVAASHRVHGPMPFDDKLIFDLKPGR